MCDVIQMFSARTVFTEPAAFFFSSFLQRLLTCKIIWILCVMFVFICNFTFKTVLWVTERCIQNTVFVVLHGLPRYNNYVIICEAASCQSRRGTFSHEAQVNDCSVTCWCSICESYWCCCCHRDVINVSISEGDLWSDLWSPDLTWGGLAAGRRPGLGLQSVCPRNPPMLCCGTFLNVNSSFLHQYTQSFFYFYMLLKIK